MDEWIRNIAEVLGFNEVDPNLFALVLLINVVIFSIAIYRVVAIKYNLPLPKWIKEGFRRQYLSRYRWMITSCE